MLEARYEEPGGGAADDCVGGGCVELRIVGKPDRLYGRLEYVGNIVASDEDWELVGHVRTATVMTNAVDRAVSRMIATSDQRVLTRLCEGQWKRPRCRQNSSPFHLVHPSSFED